MLCVAEPMHTTILQPGEGQLAQSAINSSAPQLQAAELSQQQQQASQSQQAHQALEPQHSQQVQRSQQPQHGQSQQAQQAQQEGSPTGLPQGSKVGGVLRKPKLVGIGHMCRAVNDLTGGKLATVTGQNAESIAHMGLSCSSRKKTHNVGLHL